MSTDTVRTKPCSYGCNKMIYWNVLQNAYYEAVSKQKHICPNRKAQSAPSSQRPKYDYQKPYYNKYSSKPKEEKPDMSNSFEYLVGKKDTVREEYQKLSAAILDAKGRVHGSQSHVLMDDKIALFVYYEVPKGYLPNVQETVKQFRT